MCLLFIGACLFCDGVCLWWRPDDAHTQWCLFWATQHFLCGLRHTWSAVPPWPPHSVQVWRTWTGPAVVQIAYLWVDCPYLELTSLVSCHLQRSEAGQLVAGHRRLCQDRRFWPVQRRHGLRWPHQHLLWDPRVPGTRSPDGDVLHTLSWLVGFGRTSLWDAGWGGEHRVLSLR